MNQYKVNLLFGVVLYSLTSWLCYSNFIVLRQSWAQLCLRGAVSYDKENVMLLQQKLLKWTLVKGSSPPFVFKTQSVSPLFIIGPRSKSTTGYFETKNQRCFKIKNVGFPIVILLKRLPWKFLKIVNWSLLEKQKRSVLGSILNLSWFLHIYFSYISCETTKIIQ